MSWMASYDVTDRNMEQTSLAASETPEHEEQQTAALKAVIGLIESGAVGDPTGSYKVVISGHGNPGHEPADGWGNDFISINVSQVSSDGSNPADTD